MNVTTLLEGKGHDVATIDQAAPVTEALGQMREHGIGALVVTGATPPLVGIVSERDVVRHLAERGASILNEPVSVLMSSSVTTCDPTTSATTLMGIMTEHRIRHVPVLEDNRLIGIVSIGDVVKARFDELERERRDLLDYVSAR
jgi:CBS domain-containing protein